MAMRAEWINLELNLAKARGRNLEQRNHNRKLQYRFEHQSAMH